MVPLRAISARRCASIAILRIYTFVLFKYVYYFIQLCVVWIIIVFNKKSFVFKNRLIKKKLNFTLIDNKQQYNYKKKKKKLKN